MFHIEGFDDMWVRGGKGQGARDLYNRSTRLFFSFFFFAIDGHENGHRPDEKEYYAVDFFVCLFVVITLVRAMETWRGMRDYYKC